MPMHSIRIVGVGICLGLFATMLGCSRPHMSAQQVRPEPSTLPAWVNEPIPSFPETFTRDEAAAKTLEAFYQALVAADMETAASHCLDDSTSRQVLQDLVESSRVVREMARLRSESPDNAASQHFDNWRAAVASAKGGMRITANRASGTTDPNHERIGLVRADGVWKVDVLSYDNGTYRREPLRARFELARVRGKLEVVRSSPNASYYGLEDAAVLAEHAEMRRYPAAIAIPAPDLSSAESALREAFIASRLGMPVSRVEQLYESSDFTRTLARLRQLDDEWNARLLSTCLKHGVDCSVSTRRMFGACSVARPLGGV